MHLLLPAHSNTEADNPEYLKNAQGIEMKMALAAPAAETEPEKAAGKSHWNGQPGPAGRRAAGCAGQKISRGREMVTLPGTGDTSTRPVP